VHLHTVKPCIQRVASRNTVLLHNGWQLGGVQLAGGRVVFHLWFTKKHRNKERDSGGKEADEG
jgi:hypothetical protein